MSQFPENVIDFDVIKIKNNMSKKCTCLQKKFNIDPNIRKVYCKFCGGEVEPFDALYYLAKNGEELQRQVRSLLEQRERLIAKGE